MQNNKFQSWFIWRTPWAASEKSPFPRYDSKIFGFILSIFTFKLLWWFWWSEKFGNTWGRLTNIGSSREALKWRHINVSYVLTLVLKANEMLSISVTCLGKVLRMNSPTILAFPHFFSPQTPNVHVFSFSVGREMGKSDPSKSHRMDSSTIKGVFYQKKWEERTG